MKGRQEEGAELQYLPRYPFRNNSDYGARDTFFSREALSRRHPRRTAYPWVICPTLVQTLSADLANEASCRAEVGHGGPGVPGFVWGLARGRIEFFFLSGSEQSAFSSAHFCHQLISAPIIPPIALFLIHFGIFALAGKN